MIITTIFFVVKWERLGFGSLISPRWRMPSSVVGYMAGEGHICLNLFYWRSFKKLLPHCNIFGCTNHDSSENSNCHTAFIVELMFFLGFDCILQFFGGWWRHVNTILFDFWFHCLNLFYWRNIFGCTNHDSSENSNCLTAFIVELMFFLGFDCILQFFGGWWRMKARKYKSANWESCV